MGTWIPTAPWGWATLATVGLLAALFVWWIVWDIRLKLRYGLRQAEYQALRSSRAAYPEPFDRADYVGALIHARDNGHLRPKGRLRDDQLDAIAFAIRAGNLTLPPDPLRFPKPRGVA